MLMNLADNDLLLAVLDIQAWVQNTVAFLKVVIGFSLIVFVHELGHFLFAKWSNVKVERFAVGFGPRVCGYRKGQGFTFGASPSLKADELRERGWSETDYCFNALPFGGYVKMLGEDDILVDEKTGEMSLTDDPRAFTNRPVGQRMLITSAGVVFNLVFAAALFMAVFLVGHRMMAPVLGMPDVNTAAANAGLQAGDRVLSINGHSVVSFNDILYQQAFNERLALEIQRDGQVLSEPVVVRTQYDRDTGMRSAGLKPVLRPIIARDVEPVDDRPAPRRGDEIVAVAGAPADSFGRALVAFNAHFGEVVPLEVKRRAGQPGGEPETVTVYHRAQVVFVNDPYRADEDTPRRFKNSLFGMIPRMEIHEPIENGPADRAGLQPDDVIVQLGTTAHPTYTDIHTIVQASAGKAIPIAVLRPAPGGALDRIETEIRPERPFSLFAQRDAKIQARLRIERALPVIADTAPNTPAAALQLPRGARLTAVAGTPVANWGEVVRAFKAHAGATVTLGFTIGDQQNEIEFAVPGSVVNALDLPADARIIRIAGEKSIKTDDGETLTLPGPEAVEAMLRRHVGETVEIVYERIFAPNAPQTTLNFTVTPNNLIPWQRYVSNVPEVGLPTPVEELVTADGNPLRAMWMGLEDTYIKVMLIYKSLQKMATGGLSVRNVSGPVGIIDRAVDEAKSGVGDLLYFLAFLSINLAVINFLPIPVVDGGVMVFLIIEKLRGKPLSLKVQMISSLVGLALILSVAVLVTFQDILRLFDGP